MKKNLFTNAFILSILTFGAVINPISVVFSQTPETEVVADSPTGDNDAGTPTDNTGEGGDGNTPSDTNTGGENNTDGNGDTGDGTGTDNGTEGSESVTPPADNLGPDGKPIETSTTTVSGTGDKVTSTTPPTSTTVVPTNNNNTNTNTQPIYFEPYIPPVSQPSTNPSTIQRVQPTQPPKEEDRPEDDESKIDLIQGDYVCFNANIFKTEKEADEFIKLIEKDEAAKGNIRTMKEVIKKDFVLVRVFYEDNADHKKKWILFYVATQFKDQKEAEKYIEENLLIYPDVFFKGQVIKTDGKFNVVFGIRSTINTQALTYKEDTLKIEYLYPRQEYKYKVKLNKETMKFEDPIPEAVEKAFPGKFTFTSQALTPDEEEVTMTPVKDSENQVTEETTTTGQ